MRPRLSAVVASSLVPLLCAALALPATAADAPAPYAPSAGAAPEAPAPAAPALDPNDEVLRRLLRSGCRDGLPEARALAQSGATPWSATVARLCGEILSAAPPMYYAPPPLARPVRTERDGRAAIVIASAAYGIWVGIAADVLFEVDDIRGAIVGPMLGMGAGLGLSLLVTAEHPIENGQSWTIITGMDYGSINGALWAGSLNLDATEVVGSALATGLGSSAIGLLVANKFRPRQGDIEVVRSGLLWGTVTGLLAMAMIGPDSKETTFLRATAVSMDLGFLAGLALASSFNVSRNRDLIIDSGMLGGGFVGFGITWLATAGPNPNGRTLAGGTIAGIYAGMALTMYLTREMDDDDDDDHDAPAVAALYGRDARGRWGWGSPGPVPVLDGTGRRVVGATVTALGGTF